MTLFLVFLSFYLSSVNDDKWWRAVTVTVAVKICGHPIPSFYHMKIIYEFCSKQLFFNF